MDRYTPFEPLPPTNCRECGYLDVCGGLDDRASDRGCFQRCTEYCQYHSCDLACPCLHQRFPRLIEDVGGLCTPPKCKLLPCSDGLPLYVPQIYHGSGRLTPLSEPVVAIPFTAIAGRDLSGKYRIRYSTPDELRDSMQLDRSAQIIVTSVAYDHFIEDFWAEHSTGEIVSRIAALNIRGMTVPNYSFMLDAPRINALYNLTRIFRLAERISAAGIPTILHLQASTQHDWKRWRSVLNDQPETTCVSLEFQTGPKQQKIGNRYYEGLLQLRDSLNRLLHPIFIGGSGRVRTLARNFASFTVIDATPFMKTVHRQVAHSDKGGGNHSVMHSNRKGVPLSVLLEQHIRARRGILSARAASECAQLDLAPSM